MTECPIELKPMADWVQEGECILGPSELCHECILGPIVQWYTDELETRGHTQLAQELNQVATGDDSTYLEICEKLDIIKKQADESLRERLLEFDCAAQTFDPNALPA